MELEQTLLLPSDKEVVYLPSIGAITKIVYRDIDLPFKVTYFLKCSYMENAERKMLSYDFYSD